MTTMIQIQLNADEQDVALYLSVAELLGALELRPRMIVFEDNGEILRRERYPSVPVEAGDSLELVQFVGGG